MMRKKITSTIFIAFAALITSFKADSYVFNIPALKGRKIKEINKILGKPTDANIPTSTQAKMGVTGHEDFTRRGFTLQIEFNPTTGKVLNMFLGKDQSVHNVSDLVKAGNLSNTTTFKIVPVRQNTNPNLFTGITILPN